MIMCIDLKSFFAACECVERNLDPFKVNLVVANKDTGDGAIILAITPHLKSLGVKSRCRIRDLPKNIKITYAKPRMKLYLDKSMEILQMYLEFFSSEDILVYSVDEVFIDLSPYVTLYKCSEIEIATKVKDILLKRMSLHSSVGIGDNMILAKFAMDIDSKKAKNSIAVWRKSDVPYKLWNVKDLKQLWGINYGIEKRLHNINIYNVKQLAHTDVNFLIKHFGVYGEKLHKLANGIDDTVISRDIHYVMPKSYGKSQTLHNSIDSSNVYLLIRELLETLVMKLKIKNYVAKKIFIHVSYDFRESYPSLAKSISMTHPTDDLHIFLNYINEILDNNLKVGQVRKLGVTVADLSHKEYIQLDLFSDYIKNNEVDMAMTNLKQKYGKSSVLYATALLDESTVLQRNKLIGGHNGGNDE